MRIVHFSDLHITCWPRELSALCDKRVLGLLNFALRRRHQFHPEYVERAVLRIRTLNPDWVILTGDITSVGTGSEFVRALEVLAPLCETHTPFELLFVPGNHDNYVRKRACREALESTFARLNRNRWRLADLPQCLELPGLRVFVADESYPTSPWQSGGTLSALAWEKLQGWFAEPRKNSEKRLLVGHFPCRRGDGTPLPRRRRLHGGDLLWNALRDGRVDMALCGHHHQPFLRCEPNGAMEICAGALTVYGKINVLDFTPLTGKFSQFWVDVSGDGRTPVPLRDTAILPAAP